MSLRESRDRGVRTKLGSKGDRNRLTTPLLQVPLKAEACSMAMTRDHTDERRDGKFAAMGVSSAIDVAKMLASVTLILHTLQRQGLFLAMPSQASIQKSGESLMQ